MKCPFCYNGMQEGGLRHLKLMAGYLAVIVLLAALLSLFGCSSQSGITERETTVAVSVEADGVYGVLFEYSIDRVRTGGQMLSQDPDMTKPLPRDNVYANFSEQGFHAPEDLENGTFGILVWVVLENGEEVPIEYLWEWAAAYGESYQFTLSGDEATGFSFAPNEDLDCIVTPWDELPGDFLE